MLRGKILPALLTLWLLPSVASAQPCQPSWTRFPGGDVGIGGVLTMAPLNLPGQGLSLVLGGGFTSAGHLSGLSNLVAWNGDDWSSMGGGVAGPVYAITEFDPSTGSRVFVGGGNGTTSGFLRSWDGQSWTDVMQGEFIASVNALTVFNDGSGPALYVGMSGPISLPQTYGIARWNGSQWSSVAGGISGSSVRVMKPHHDAQGPCLLVGGAFGAAGGVPANCIALYRATSWTSLGTGPVGVISALEFYDDGSGPRLHAAGGFSNGINGVAKWDGQAWTPLGAGTSNGVSGGNAYALAAYDDGSGSALYVGGSFLGAGGLNARSVARWDGQAWSRVSVASFTIQNLFQGPVHSFAIYDEGDGPALFAGGDYPGPFPGSRIAKWKGRGWSLPGQGANRPVTVLSEGPDGELFVGGRFGAIADVSASLASRVAGSWTPLAQLDSTNTNNPSSTVRALEWFDHGSGLDLYAGGALMRLGQAPIGLATQTGNGWTVPGGIQLLEQRINALKVFDDGSGQALFAAGDFNISGTPPMTDFARWNGVAWTSLPSLLPFFQAFSLAIFDDGSGESLYLGGTNGQSTPSVVRWNGTSYAPVGSTIRGSVYALASFDDGTGPALYAGGAAVIAAPSGGFHHIARWNGTQWSTVGGRPPAEGNSVDALAVADVGSGPALFAGGTFASAAGPSYIARWNGAEWESLGVGVNGPVYALTTVREAGRDALYVGGDFNTADGRSSLRLARWGCTAALCYANCDQSTTAPILNVADFTCFLQRFAAADPYANCDASTAPPTLNVADFTCFLQRFAAGCP